MKYKKFFRYIIFFVCIICFFKKINCDLDLDNNIDLYVDRTCSYAGEPKLIGNTIVCDCVKGYTTKKVTLLINGKYTPQCNYYQKKKSVMLFFNIFIPYGFGYLYIEQYLLFFLVFVFMIIVTVLSLINFFNSNKFVDGGNNLNNNKAKTDIDNLVNKDVSDKKNDGNRCYTIIRNFVYFLWFLAFAVWVFGIVAVIKGYFKDGQKIALYNDLGDLLRVKS